jgi:hypothetical protein
MAVTLWTLGRLPGSAYVSFNILRQNTIPSNAARLSVGRGAIGVGKTSAARQMPDIASRLSRMQTECYSLR